MLLLTVPAYLERIRLYLGMIKFSHSVFALPFALTGALLAAAGLPSFRQISWIVVAMVSARSGAMGLNRIIDREIDAENPRTRQRELPSGKIAVRDAALFTFIAFAIFVFAAYRLNPLCFRLSPAAIATVAVYSYTKRFTWFSHLVLGAAISLGPLGAWIAVSGSFAREVIPLCIAVVFWLAGFDILYALQDVQFDRSRGLYSIPGRFGIGKALVLSRLFHGTTLLLLFVTGFLFDRGLFYWIGIGLVTFLFAYEHSLVKKYDLSKLDMAFFNMNGYISVTVFVFTLLDYLIRLG